jgi:hypothetical protein
MTATILQEGLGYKQASFAEALRLEVATVTVGRARIPHEIVCDPHLEELAGLLVKCRGVDPWIKPTPPKMRRVLQLWGTEYRRRQDYDYWVKQIQIDSTTAITDVRFENEVEAVRQRGGVIWWVHRTFLPEELPPAHSSEDMNQDVADRIIWNDGTIEDLKIEVLDAMRTLS